ncbi:DUF6916 family protein [Methylohalobius crimeensis]|uniref:DUF6916 family protein n=1 Tax=Methylohalobius crimeensis TaxID=244365 RepID=UPI0003B4FC95|nr:hypothetical protein [Methylohalobius crimeensis]
MSDTPFDPDNPPAKVEPPAEPPVAVSPEDEGKPLLGRLTKDDFEKHLNQSFRITLEDEAVDFTLVEVTELPRKVSNAEVAKALGLAERAPFTMIFRGPREAESGQGTFAVEHPEMGHMSLFMVPVQGTDEHIDYEVIFT